MTPPPLPLLPPRFRDLCASIALLLCLTSCSGGSGAGDFDASLGELDATLAPSEVEGVDLLFVVDNSGSMLEEQGSLTANFNRFVNVLDSIEGGRPDLHIGVVSTDMGAGPFGISGCSGAGDDGILQVAPADACTPPGPERYISDIANSDGTRITNYSDSLSDAFSCIARLGINGCGFEQPLAAMRRALDGSHAENSGFLRAEALLAVVIITDEDDCSVENIAMFDSDPSLDTVDSSLGPLSSFRCFEFGVQCNPDTPRTSGARDSCTPRTDSPYMPDVSEYADFLKGLKDDPNKVVVAAITGNSTPVTVGSLDGEPRLEASCQSSSGNAAPAIRMQGLVDLFPQRGTITTICNDDLSDALTVVAELLVAAIAP